MRVVKEVHHPHCKITIFAWNNRYLLKLEEGFLEQTFKIDQLEIDSEEQLLKVIDTEFIDQALRRFRDMDKSLYEARERADH
jgi:hypothetical protein